MTVLALTLFPEQALPKEKVVAALMASWGLSLARNRKRKGIFILLRPLKLDRHIIVLLRPLKLDRHIIVEQYLQRNISI